MAKKIYVGENNTARNVKKLYIGVNNLAREVKKVYVGVNNVARLCWQSSPTVACYIPRMTSNTTPSGVASASSYWQGNEPKWAAWHAFGTAQSPSWAPQLVSATYPNPWIIYDFGYLVQPTGMSFRLYTGRNTATIPWYLQGSKDHSNWTNLKTFNIKTSTSRVDFSTTISTTEMYRYFKFTCTYNNTYEIELSMFYLNGLRY